MERGDFEGFVEQQEGVGEQRWYTFYQVERLRAVAEDAQLRVVDEFIGGPSAHSAGFVVLYLRK